MIQMTLPQYLRHECTINGRMVPLRKSLADLLALMLVSGPDKFLSTQFLIEAMWPDPDFEPDWAETIVFRRIHELRMKGVQIERRYIFGYRIPRWAREEAEMREAA